MLLLRSIGMTVTVSRFLVIFLPLTSYCSDSLLVSPIILIVVTPVFLLITIPLGLASTCIGTIHC